jgi:exonuclease VII large subunit
LTAQKERLDGIRERLHKSIDEVQKKEDVDFEIFSPRADMRVSKEMLNEMHQQMNDVKRQQAQTARELEEVTAKLDKFLYMLEGAESAGLMFRMFHVKHFQDFGMLKTGYLKKEVL